MKLIALIRSLRPEQWLKSGFVLMPLIFSHELFVAYSLFRALLYAACFSALSSGVYLFNDLMDRERDLSHPEKGLRPIAAGKLPIEVAWGAALVLVLFASFGAFQMHKGAALILAVYLVLNIFYTLKAKSIVLLDVLCIAAGFVLRVLGGAMVIGVVASEWLLLCTLMFALFLGLCKRRQELVALGHGSTAHRASLSGYSLVFLDNLIVVSAACSLLAYALYTVAPATVEKFGSNWLFWTLPMVVYGIFRYLFLIQVKERRESTATLVLRDGSLIITIVGWLLLCGLIVYKAG